MKRLQPLLKNTHSWFLLGVCVVFFLLRLPSLFEPYWYGDEGIYEVIGYALRHGRTLYSGIWDNKPPFLYITYALFSGDQFSIRLLSLIAGTLAVVMFYFVAKRLFAFHRSIFLATGFFALFFALPLLEGNIANAENFMLAFTTSASYLVLRYTSQKKSSFLTIAGVLLAIAFLFKIVAIFDVAAFCFFLLLAEYKNISLLFQQAKTVTALGIAFITPIFLTALYFLLQGSFWDFFKGTFSQNVGYVGYGNSFIIPQGLLVIKLVLLLFVCVLVFWRRKQTTKTELFIYLWSSFAVFDAFFSQRPYTHYMLVLLPSISLLFGLLFWQKAKLNIAFVAFIGIVFLLLLNFHFYGKNVSYYQNFLSYLFGSTSTTNYEAFFDQNTVRDYGVAYYLKRHKSATDTVFIWGNSAQIYRLSNTLPPGRYTVAYHITTSKAALDETEKALEKSNPKYVIILQNSSVYPFSLLSYQEKVSIANATIYMRD